MRKLSDEDCLLLQTELKHLKESIVTYEAICLQLFDKSVEGIILLNQHQQVVYLNDKAATLINKNQVDCLGDVLALDDSILSVLNISKSRILWKQEPSDMLYLRDKQQMKETKDVLKYMLECKVIVNRVDRMDFEKKLHEAIQAAITRQKHMAVLYLNLDNFKRVNTTLGHQAGDALLQNILSVLEYSVRKGDTIARLDGDEFALILTHLRKPEYAGVVAQNVLLKLDKPFNIQETPVHVNASIGIAVYPLSGNTAVELLTCADSAMRASKMNGKNQYRFYTDILDEVNERLLKISTGLRNAIKKEEFFIVYQPIIDLKTRRCSGIEALLRWEHPTLGVLSPEEFLPEVEKVNLMLQVGKWVTRRVFNDFKMLNSKTLVFISVNITANELSETKIVKDILAAVQEFDVDLTKIIFELTETSFVIDPEGLVKKLDSLSKTPIKLAIDDYGTGYSSLSYLKRLPVAILKIDQSFVQSINQYSNSNIILKSTIKLAHNLGVQVIAEGVQTKEQLAFLEQNKCDYVQGFYF
jgi:diguanylate cyclase (GGDEF)-like protein